MNEYEHGDYIIYADESGDHSRDDVNKLYPIFVLAFCIFSKRAYLEDVVKLIKGVKFAFWGHDMTIFHSAKLRKRMDDYQFLHDQVKRVDFIEKLNVAIVKSPFEIISMAIDKRLIKKTLPLPSNPYELCLEHCVEKIYQFLQNKNQQHKLTYIIIESRGKKEDAELAVAFHKIVETHYPSQMMYPIKLIFADKKTNSIGLQMADLIAYPIGRFLLTPEQENLAFQIVEKKLYQYPAYDGDGLKIARCMESLKKRKTPEFSEV